ncbi:MAG: hypothetical protein KGL93_04300, partial [Gemmatimonadota bacterium]|nr:hypothetical protein [Gemmatimonadota bacterium]
MPLSSYPARTLLRSRSFSAVRPLAASLATLAIAASTVAAQSTGIVAPRPAGAQQADQDGRTLLPMKVARSIAFRSIGPAVSGGRVSAVAGVPGQNDT